MERETVHPLLSQTTRSYQHYLKNQLSNCEPSSWLRSDLCREKHPSLLPDEDRRVSLFPDTGPSQRPKTKDHVVLCFPCPLWPACRRREEGFAIS